MFFLDVPNPPHLFFLASHRAAAPLDTSLFPTWTGDDRRIPIMMNYFLTDEQETIRSTAREIAEKKIKPVREKHDREDSFPWEIVDELRKADLFGVYFHETYGGIGGAGFELVLAIEELSKVCGGIAL